MKQSTKQLIGFTAVAALVVGAASGGFGPGWGGHHGMMGGPGTGYGHGPGHMMVNYSGEALDQRLADQKVRIGITADQETAWTAYTTAVKGKYDLMQSHRQARFGDTGVDANQIQSFHQQGLTQMQKVLKATQGLYAVLTPEQQTQAGNLIGPRHGLR